MENNEQFKVESYISDSRLAFIQGKYEESLKLAKQALEMDSKNPDAH
ncbi:MAG: tetratricopeptide repeat protein [Ruminococcus sp.]|nr:tetratricopeptide repeat protein [Ruminococcus sp.]